MLLLSILFERDIPINKINKYNIKTLSKFLKCKELYILMIYEKLLEQELYIEEICKALDNYIPKCYYLSLKHVYDCYFNKKNKLIPNFNNFISFYYHDDIFCKHFNNNWNRYSKIPLEIILRTLSVDNDNNIINALKYYPEYVLYDFLMFYCALKNNKMIKLIIKIYLLGFINDKRYSLSTLIQCNFVFNSNFIIETLDKIIFKFPTKINKKINTITIDRKIQFKYRLLYPKKLFNYHEI